MEEIWGNIVNWVQGPGMLLVKVLAILVIGYFVAKIAKWAIAKAIDSIGFVANANAENEGGGTIGQSFGTAVYWIVLLYVILTALSTAGLKDQIEPLYAFFDEMMAFLPNLVGAVLILAVFTIVGKVAAQALKAVLSATSLESVPQKIGIADGPVNIAGPLALFLQVFLIFLGLSSAVDVLGIEAIATPVKGILDTVMGAIPNVLVASVIFAIVYYISKLVTQLLKSALPQTGIDKAVADMGLLSGADEGVNVSNILASTAGIVILLFGGIQAIEYLQFDAITAGLEVVRNQVVQIIFGSLIIFVGLIVSGLIARAIDASGSGASDVMAKVVRYVIIALASIMGIARMGLDPTGGEFVLKVATILVFFAGLAAALAFGLGGKEWAKTKLDSWKG